MQWPYLIKKCLIPSYPSMTTGPDHWQPIAGPQKWRYNNACEGTRGKLALFLSNLYSSYADYIMENSQLLPDAHKHRTTLLSLRVQCSHETMGQQRRRDDT